MGMGAATDHTLEKLAANVRAATTTSASDRAKQIFVQAWCVVFLDLQGSFCGDSHLRLCLFSFFVLLLTCL